MGLIFSIPLTTAIIWPIALIASITPRDPDAPITAKTFYSNTSEHFEWISHCPRIEYGKIATCKIYITRAGTTDRPDNASVNVIIHGDSKLTLLGAKTTPGVFVFYPIFPREGQFKVETIIKTDSIEDHFVNDVVIEPDPFEQPLDFGELPSGGVIAVFVVLGWLIIRQFSSRYYRR